MTTFDTLAVCLRTTPFQEADRVVTFYSAHHGELRAIARGIKKPLGKLAGACEALTLNRVYLARGRTLHTVCHYERVESFPRLRHSLERLAAGTTCADAIRFLGQENDPDSASVYELLARTLHALDNPAIPWIGTSLRFHTGLLHLAGYLPSFTRCTSCQKDLPLDAAPFYPFFLEQGGFACRRCQAGLTDANGVNMSSRTLRLFANLDDQAMHGQAVKAHRFLAYYWGQRLDRELRSFDFLLELLDSPASAGTEQTNPNEERALLGEAGD